MVRKAQPALVARSGGVRVGLAQPASFKKKKNGWLHKCLAPGFFGLIGELFCSVRFTQFTLVLGVINFCFWLLNCLAHPFCFGFGNFWWFVIAFWPS